MGSIIVSSSLLPVLFFLGFWQYTLFYPHIETHGWPNFFLSILLAMIIQDTYFYWTHRLMHHRLLFRWFHRTHHRSTNINPWSTYSIHPLEALVDSGAFWDRMTGTLSPDYDQHYRVAGFRARQD